MLRIWSMRFSLLVPTSSQQQTSCGRSSSTPPTVDGGRRVTTSSTVVTSDAGKTRSTLSSGAWFKGWPTRTMFLNKNHYLKWCHSLSSVYKLMAQHIVTFFVKFEWHCKICLLVQNTICASMQNDATSMINGLKS